MAHDAAARTGAPIVNPILDAWGEVSECDEGTSGNGSVPSTVVNYRRHLRECDEVLAKHLGPTTPVRREIRKLLKESYDRY